MQYVFWLHINFETLWITSLNLPKHPLDNRRSSNGIENKGIESKQFQRLILLVAPNQPRKFCSITNVLVDLTWMMMMMTWMMTRLSLNIDVTRTIFFLQLPRLQVDEKGLCRASNKSGLEFLEECCTLLKGLQQDRPLQLINLSRSFQRPWLGIAHITRLCITTDKLRHKLMKHWPRKP